MPSICAALEIESVFHSPGVGAHLLEHRLMWIRYDMRGPYSTNLQIQGVRLIGNVLR